MTLIDWMVILFYCAGLVAVGEIFSRTTKSASGMFVAGRQSPWWLSGISSYMTMFSAGTFVVWGGIAYEYGLVGAIICCFYGIAAFLAGRFFAGKWRRTCLSTAGEYIQLRYGKGAFHFYTWYGVFMLFMGGMTIYGLAVMLCPLMPLSAGNFLRDGVTGNLSVDWACIILAAIVIFYTMKGGLWAVLMTDTLQFFVLMLAVIVVVPLIIAKVGGVSAFLDQAPAGFLKPTAPGFSWAFLVGWLLLNTFQLGANWSYIQRHLCVPTERDARRGMYLFGVLYLFTPFLWMAPPMIYRVLHPGADPQEAYILACSAVLPPGIIGMMVAAMFSATASSMSSTLNTFAGVLTDDVYRRLWRPQATEAETVRAGRVFTVLIGLYILAGALILPRFATYRDVVIVMASLLGGSLMLPTLWGLWSRRVGPGVVWGTIASGVVVGILQKYGFSQGGWFGKVEAMSGLVSFVRAHTRETDIFIGLAVPLTILVIAEWRGQLQPGWERLQAAIAKAQSDDAGTSTATTDAARLPILVVSLSLGFLAVLMLGLTPFSGDRWPTLLGMSALLLMFSAFFARLLRRRSTSDLLDIDMEGM
jgi:SSS family solute:Na+ symporter